MVSGDSGRIWGCFSPAFNDADSRAIPILPVLLSPHTLEHTDVGSRSCNSHGCLCQAMRTDPSAACPRAAPPSPQAPWPPRRAPRRPVAFCRPHRGCRPRRGCHRARPARQVCRRREHLGSGNDRCGGFLSQDIIAGWFISWKIHENPIKSYKNGRFGGTLILGNLHVVAPIFFWFIIIFFHITWPSK